ncbi:MAG: hypothetical protein IM622_13265 [Phenylobacterium sp.]|uniref:hypothetical protein n=1 Tax=Phenylobacterium sp. TaxID=1871053 RepID=UPI0025CDBA2F|nr:hypothetical protein [Phenylobacterium sp.]MCA6346713.1 hypothetical protein [Phenylobacterium sp.]
MLYQRKTLPDTNIGDPAPLPAALVGLSDASLADLSAALGVAADETGFAGQGFFPFTPEPPPPPPVDQLHKVDFLRLFTQAERIAIRQAAKVNPIVEDYQDMLDAATVIRLSDPDIQEGIPDLEDAGLIGPGRAAQILSGENP